MKRQERKLKCIKPLLKPQKCRKQKQEQRTRAMNRVANTIAIDSSISVITLSMILIHQ